MNNYKFNKNKTKINNFLKKIIIFLYFFVIFSYLLLYNSTYTNNNFYADNYYSTYNVDHLFTHCLIAYPEIAFCDNNPMAKHYKNDCITSNEFKKILLSLYDNNYILVDINSCFINENGIVKKKLINVPIGKKPLILSFDDVNYDSKKLGKGMVDKIALDKDNNLISKTSLNNFCDTRYDLEFICILEEFVKNFPSFSPFGAKGTICLTGYNGILGYRTQSKNTLNRNSEIEEAKKVVNTLKEKGWNFACHSYGHYHMKKISENKFKEELDLFKHEVESIVGKTNIYVYPYGEWEIYENKKISKKHQLLVEYGFELFCGVWMKSFYGYLPFEKSESKFLFFDRKNIDGYSLQKNKKELLPFFDCSQVYDSETRKTN